MPYWVFDQTGQIAAVVSESDPDLQRVLAKPQNRAPAWVAPQMPGAMAAPQPAWTPQAQAPVAWAQPAPQTTAVRRHPASVADGDTVYRVRHVPTGRFLGEGLDPRKDIAPKTWPNRGNAKNAVSHAIRRGLGSEKEFEIVPLSLG